MPLGLEFRAAASTGAPPDAAGPTAGPPLPGKTLAPGSLLDGRYLIQEELGRGGMGRVFAARDARIARPVAIKILSPGAHDDEDLRRFEQEARTAGSLNHPNIVAVLDIGKHEGEPYIVSELLEGTTLRERLRAG